jgi:hypothetical protein
MSHNPIIDFAVGDLVTYRTSTGIAGNPPFIGMVMQVESDVGWEGLGHLMIFWLHHSSFKGQVKCHYPADVKKILDKS